MNLLCPFRKKENAKVRFNPSLSLSLFPPFSKTFLAAFVLEQEQAHHLLWMPYVPSSRDLLCEQCYWLISMPSSRIDWKA
jgi:hypothetical protein